MMSFAVDAFQDIMFILVVYGWLPVGIITALRLLGRKRHAALFSILSVLWFLFYLLVHTVSRP